MASNAKKRPFHTKSKWQVDLGEAPSEGPTYAYCMVSSSDFSVSRGGVYNMKYHCKSIKHTRLLKDIEAQLLISSSLTTSTPTWKDDC